MNAWVFKDTTIELARRGDSVLAEMANLTLEFGSNGAVLIKVKLLLNESERCIWKASGIIVLDGNTPELKVSVLVETDQNEPQLLGYMELNRVEMDDTIGTQYEFPLISHDSCLSLVLKTTILDREDSQKLVTFIKRQFELQSRDEISEGGSRESPTTHSDLGHNRNMEGQDRTDLQAQDLVRILGDGSSTINTLEDQTSASGNLFDLGRVADIDEVVVRAQAAVNLTPDDHPQKPVYLYILGLALRMRFERIGELADLENAISRQQEALNFAPDGHPERSHCLLYLGASFLTRFERFGNLADINDAIALQQAAVNLLPNGHPFKPSFLSSLGNSLRISFQRSGNIMDIDNAISRLEEAIDLAPDSEPGKAGYLNNLGISLRLRFKRLGISADIDNAISQQRAAVDLASDDHSEKPSYLSNLGNSLFDRFTLHGNLLELDRAILDHETAVNLTPDSHPYKHRYLSSLGNSLQTRFKYLGALEDIEKSILYLQMAVNLTVDGHPQRPSNLINLGGSLLSRFTLLQNAVDLEDAISYEQTAVNLIPDGHPDKPGYLISLASSIQNRFHSSHGLQDAEIIISCLSSAANSSIGSPSIRLTAAEMWISFAGLTSHESLLFAYECALHLMPLVAWLGLSIPDRHQHLAKMGRIVRDGAAAAIYREQYDKALEWLEQGRSIVWTQILQLRTPVDHLRTVNPGLANRLLQVSQMLDQGIPQGSISARSMRSMEEEGRRYRALTTEWETIIEQVRSLPDFENFLAPLSSSHLNAAARDGPVVVLNVAKERCDALAILPGLEEIVHIPLPEITFERVIEIKEEVKDLLHSGGLRMQIQRAAMRVTGENSNKGFKQILAELWDKIVKPVIDSLALSPHPDVLPRIWWCATGPLAFLPIHAAGIYDSDSEESQLTNYVISSYAPTLSTLLEAFKPATGSPFKLLSVIQPSAPGTSHIPETKKELENIRHRLISREHTTLEDEEGTKVQVIRAMERCNWLHLACHGIQRSDDPTESALILQDGHLTLKEIIRLNFPQAELAFLSACQTTTGDEKLSEEAVHLAGGMLLAGYKGVVATMWSIKDELASEVTDKFYGYIIKDGQRPNHREAAEALHFSVQRLRKMPGVTLEDWIPFVHLGA